MLKPIIIGICCFSFVATSLPRISEDYNFKSDFETKIKSDFISAKNKMKFYESEQKNRYVYWIEIPERKTRIVTKISIEEIENGLISIKLDSILNFRIQGSGLLFYSSFDEEDVKYIKSLTQLKIEQLFSESIKEQLNEK